MRLTPPRAAATDHEHQGRGSGCDGLWPRPRGDSVGHCVG
jgi:hypothetical protein